MKSVGSAQNRCKNKDFLHKTGARIKWIKDKIHLCIMWFLNTSGGVGCGSHLCPHLDLLIFLGNDCG